MPASLEGCRECSEEVSEWSLSTELTGDDCVVGEEEAEDAEEEEDDEKEDGDTEGEQWGSLLKWSSRSGGESLTALPPPAPVPIRKDWSPVGERFEVSVIAEEMDSESAVVAVVFARPPFPPPFSSNTGGTEYRLFTEVC